MTKITAVSPAGDCPKWLRFLARITGDNTELQAFLQRFLGYCLTRHHPRARHGFGYGTGANGKGTSSTPSPASWRLCSCRADGNFTATQNERHPTDLAMLRGARLVTARGDRGRAAVGENQIKAMTGGDPITARFMRQDFFTFLRRSSCSSPVTTNRASAAWMRQSADG